MIEIRDAIIEALYSDIQAPIIPNFDSENRPKYPYVDYSITTTIPFDGQGNYGFNGVYSSLEIQNQISMSFNSYSDKEYEAYNLIKQIWDWFKFKGKSPLDGIGIAIVDVLEINNRTMLMVDEYESRFGFDLILRYEEELLREDLSIEEYSIIRKIKE